MHRALLRTEPSGAAGVKESKNKPSTGLHCASKVPREPGGVSAVRRKHGKIPSMPLQRRLGMGGSTQKPPNMGMQEMQQALEEKTSS